MPVADDADTVFGRLPCRIDCPCVTRVSALEAVGCSDIVVAFMRRLSDLEVRAATHPDEESAGFPRQLRYSRRL